MRISICVIDEVMEQQAQQEESVGLFPSPDTVLATGAVADALYRPFTGNEWTDPDTVRVTR